MPKILSPRQDLHIPPVTDGRSVLTADPTDLLKGLHDGQFSVLRQPKPRQVVVDFGKPIGEFWSKASGQPIYVGPTNYGSVMYGKNGVHIVPANPVQW
jgi:filamentous hemagglutinin